MNDDPQEPHEIVLQEQAPTEVAGSRTITDLLRLAVDRNVPVETLEKLVALHERVSDRLAAQEFADAMARFQAGRPPIPKSSTANIVTKGGVKFSFGYAELDQIARVIAPLLHKEGLSYSWDSVIEERTLRCVCTVRHRNGHSICASFSCPLDAADRMSGAQQVGAALTYARRQALVQVLGLSTTDEDSDGAVNATRVSAEQIAEVERLIRETGTDRAKVLKFLGVTRFEDVLAVQYDVAVRLLKAKKPPAGP